MVGTVDDPTAESSTAVDLNTFSPKRAKSTWTIPALVWAFWFHEDGTAEELPIDQPIETHRDGWLWLHLNSRRCACVSMAWHYTAAGDSARVTARAALTSNCMRAATASMASLPISSEALKNRLTKSPTSTL